MDDKNGFFAFVFDFNEENKSIMLNMVQYTLLAIIPIIIILRLTRNYTPEVDPTKGSLEIIIEVFGQLIFIILSIWFINRMIEYIPTWSTKPYVEFNHINFIISFVFILLTLQTKLGDKVRLLTDRAEETWNGKKSEDNKNVKVKQPLAHQPSQADILMQGSPPPQPIMTNNKAQTHEAPMQGMNMDIMNNDPMAANESMGGFSSW